MHDPTARPHVLVVDDEVPLLELFSDVLTDEGYAVTTCATLAAAQAVLAHTRPDLLILDLVFGGVLAGRAWLLALAQTPTTATLPVVVCSAARAELAALAPVAPASWQLLPKPFDLDALLRCLPPVRCRVVCG